MGCPGPLILEIQRVHVTDNRMSRKKKHHKPGVGAEQYTSKFTI